MSMLSKIYLKHFFFFGYGNINQNMCRLFVGLYSEHFFVNSGPWDKRQIVVVCKEDALDFICMEKSLTV